MHRLAVVAALAACSSSIGDAPHPTTTGSAAPIEPRAAVDASVAVLPASPKPPVAPGERLPDVATPLGYDLQLEVDPDNPVFRGKVVIRVQLTRETDHVWLHAEELVIAKATYRAGAKTGALTDLAIANDDDMRAFSFGGALSGEVTLELEYTGKIIDDEPEGLFRQKAGGKWYVYAQSESVFARRILPCFDEPRWKPSWKVALTAPDKLVALGNGAVVKQSVTGGKRTVELAPIASMPSYLLSIAVGPFAIVDVGSVGRGKVPARVIVPAGNQGRVGVVPQKLPAVVDALETYLDRPLPLAKLDLVAVPRFFGAMENTGLITFESSILIGDPKKWWVPRRFIRFAAHELAHQWFGNQVTQEWWDDLWLAEGFATWLGDKISDQLGAYNDPAMRRQLARLDALGADDDATPRPLRRPIDSEGVEDRFDAIAYEKGGALLEMIEEFVGNDPFRDAIRSYITKHDGKNVTSRDFVGVLSTISTDAGAVMGTYLDLGGAPVVKLDVQCTGKPVIEVRAATGTVPVCVRYPDGTGIARTCVAASAKAGSIFPPACPAWVIGNANGDGYYRIADPSHAAKAPSTPSERLTYADDLAAGVLRGDVPLAVALAESSRLSRSKDSAGVLAGALIASAIDPFVEDGVRPAWKKWLTARFGAWTKRKIVTAVDAELGEQLWTLLPRAAPGKAWFDKVVAAAKKATDKRQGPILENLGELAPEFAAPVIELAFSSFKPEKVLPAIAALLQRPTARTATWQALRERLPKLIAAAAATELDDVIAATGSLCDAKVRAEVVEAFKDKVPADMLKKPLASIDRCIARRGKIGDLAAALAKTP